MNLKGLGEAMLDLLYPPSLYCNCCGNIIDETRTYNLCDHCITHIKWDLDQMTIREGLPMARCTEYGLYERTLIFGLKYSGKTHMARDIAQIMAEKLELLQLDVDVIVPVPIHEQKERQRGYNHAALMGHYLGKLVNKTNYPHALLRTEDTLPMRGLNPAERRQNVKGKFALNEKYDKLLENKRILLIDDFFTTGSTALACKEALQVANPDEVYLLVFAARYDLHQ
ncbi:competence protein ComFC [Clostridiales Family XIII bacterium PM5-7]